MGKRYPEKAATERRGIADGFQTSHSYPGNVKGREE
jgi:hypothetical protein